MKSLITSSISSSWSTSKTWVMHLRMILVAYNWSLWSSPLFFRMLWWVRWSYPNNTYSTIWRLVTHTCSSRWLAIWFFLLRQWLISIPRSKLIKLLILIASVRIFYWTYAKLNKSMLSLSFSILTLNCSERSIKSITMILYECGCRSISMEVGMFYSKIEIAYLGSIEGSTFSLPM